jgi:hypothetical protein
MNNKPKMGRPKKGEEIKPLEAAMALIACKGNKTRAYKLLRSQSTDNTANSEGAKIFQKSSVKDNMKDKLEDVGMDMGNVAGLLKQSIMSGIGVNATNKDAIAGLKMIIDVYTGKTSDDSNIAERMALQDAHLNNISESVNQLVDQFRIYKTTATDL